jgi:sarcosine oxidase
VELVTTNEVRRRFPQFRLGDEFVGLLEQSAAFLYVEQCVLAHVRQAQELGAVIRPEEQVISWRASAGGVMVQTTAGSYSAAKLVITAGPWARHR